MGKWNNQRWGTFCCGSLSMINGWFFMIWLLKFAIKKPFLSGTISWGYVYVRVGSSSSIYINLKGAKKYAKFGNTPKQNFRSSGPQKKPKQLNLASNTPTWQPCSKLTMQYLYPNIYILPHPLCTWLRLFARCASNFAKQLSYFDTLGLPIRPERVWLFLTERQHLALLDLWVW